MLRTLFGFAYQSPWTHIESTCPGSLLWTCSYAFVGFQFAVGDKIPADARLIEINSTTLRIDQSILTGSEDVCMHPCVGMRVVVCVQVRVCPC